MYLVLVNKLSLNSLSQNHINVDTENDSMLKETSALNESETSPASKVKFVVKESSTLLESWQTPKNKHKIKIRRKHRKHKSHHKPQKVNKIRETLFALSNYCHQLEGDSKPVIEKCEFDNFRNHIMNREFY